MSRVKATNLEAVSALYLPDLTSIHITASSFSSSPTLQAQMDTKQDTILGAITPWTSSNFTTTSGRVLVSDSSAKLGLSTVTSSELALMPLATDLSYTRAYYYHGNSVGSDTWRKIYTLPAIGGAPLSANGVLITGLLFDSNGQACEALLSINTSYDFLIYGRLHGPTSGNTTLEVYRETDNSYSIYVKIGAGLTSGYNLTVRAGGSTSSFTDVGTTTDPTGTSTRVFEMLSNADNIQDSQVGGAIRINYTEISSVFVLRTDQLYANTANTGILNTSRLVHWDTTGDRALYFNASLKRLTESTLTRTEFERLSGVTANVQTQFGQRARGYDSSGNLLSSEIVLTGLRCTDVDGFASIPLPAGLFSSVRTIQVTRYGPGLSTGANIYVRLFGTTTDFSVQALTASDTGFASTQFFYEIHGL